MKKIFALPLLALALVTGCQSITPSPELEAELLPSQIGDTHTLAYWHFNTPHSGNSVMASAGTGTLNHDFASTTSFTGTTLNALSGDVAGNDFAVRASTGMQNNGKSFTLSVSTLGYENVTLSYATRRSPDGFTTQRLCYSTDGNTFPEAQCLTVTPITNTSTSNLWRIETIDFTGLAGVANNENFRVRVTVTGATETQGNNRWDNIKLTGTVAAPTAAETLQDIETEMAPETGPDAETNAPQHAEEPMNTDSSAAAQVEPEAPRGFKKGRIEAFFRPVDMTPDTFNVVRASSTVPLKFRVFDEDGTELTEPAGIRLEVFSHGSCSPTEQHVLPSEVALGSAGTIRYAGGQFIANWTVPRGANLCYAVRAVLGDGANGMSTEALFRSR